MNDELCLCTQPDSNGMTLITVIRGLNYPNIRKTGFDRLPKPMGPDWTSRKPSTLDSKLAWEMDHARQIQRHSLPEPLDLGSGLTIAGANVSATPLSGDTFDFVRLGDRLYFLLCDVSGKGLGSALIATQLARAFRVGARHGWSLQEIDGELNEAALEADKCEKYATGILGALEIDNGCLHLMAAGHNAPSLAGKEFLKPITDSTELVHSWGSRLGMREAPPVVTVPFHAGLSLVSFTDGVSDRWDSDEDGAIRFGNERITAAHRASAHQPAQEICDHVMSEALRFGQRTRAPKDDMTVLALHWRD